MFARYASAVTTGTLMTLALLYTMQGLIHLQPGAQSDPQPRSIVDWISLPRQAPPLPPPTPDYDKETITSAPVPPPGRPNGNHGPGIYIPVRSAAPTPGSTRPDRISDPDGPLISIVRVRPNYPAPALAKGLEGWVDVRFDVMTNGQVTNIHVTGSSHSMFEKAAIRAAQKFRFRAPVVDGVPQVAADVDYRFRFEMNN
jgi:protein TonB